jgi:deoxyribonuclease V
VALTESLPGTNAISMAVDVHYIGDAVARAAMVAAPERSFSHITRSQTAMVPVNAPYKPGEFYLRELPPLRAVIQACDELVLIVIDGYVDLDSDGRPGLGAHINAEFGVPVIGVAKTAFRTATHAAQVFRGQSSRPLHVTAAGMTIAEAVLVVSEMAGQFRLPDALKLADRLARGIEMPDSGTAGKEPQCRAVASGKPSGFQETGRGYGTNERLGC